MTMDDFDEPTEKTKEQQESDPDSDKEDKDEIQDVDGFQKSKVIDYGANSDSE